MDVEIVHWSRAVGQSQLVSVQIFLRVIFVYTGEGVCGKAFSAFIIIGTRIINKESFFVGPCNSAAPQIKIKPFTP